MNTETPVDDMAEDGQSNEDDDEEITEESKQQVQDSPTVKEQVPDEVSFVIGNRHRLLQNPPST